MPNDGQASYNGQTFDYVTLETEASPVVTGGAVERYNRRYHFVSHFTYSNFTNYSSGRSAIEAALEEPGKTFYYYDPSSNALVTLAPASCLGDGPIAEYRIYNELGYGFDIDVTIRADVEPQGGGGTPVDTYTDTYTWDKQNRITWRRAGTRRVSTAYTSKDAALTAVQPSTSGAKWEFVRKEGELDEDMKGLTYSFEYIEAFETLPSGFADFHCSIREARDGRRMDITLSATASVDYDSGSPKSLRSTLEKHCLGKVPKGAKVVSIDTTLDERNGSATLTISAVKAMTGDLLEFEMTMTTRKDDDYIILKRQGGGGWWIQTLGDPEYTQSVRGHKLGLNSYPSVGEADNLGMHVEKTYHKPFMGPKGEILYRVDFYGEKRGCSGAAQPWHGSGGGGGNGGSGATTPPPATVPTPSGNTITIGNVGGFSSFGAGNNLFGIR